MHKKGNCHQTIPFLIYIATVWLFYQAQQKSNYSNQNNHNPGNLINNLQFTHIQPVFKSAYKES